MHVCMYDAGQRNAIAHAKAFEKKENPQDLSFMHARMQNFYIATRSYNSSIESLLT